MATRKVFRSTSDIQGSPGFPERSGQEVEIVRPLSVPDEAAEEVGPMFRIRFSDGTFTDAFEDELFDA